MKNVEEKKIKIIIVAGNFVEKFNHMSFFSQLTLPWENGFSRLSS